MQNAQLARLFDEIADLLEIQGANAFRVRAYRNASRTIESLSESVATIAAGGVDALTELEGIGKDLAQKIVAAVQTGTIPQLEELRSQVPAGVRAMLRIEGIGPKKVGRLHAELGVNSLDDLKAACEADRVAGLKGFGKKTQESILAGLETVATAGQRFRIDVASESAQAIVDDLKTLKAVKQAAVAGSCRRRKETCGDLDVLVTCQSDRASIPDAQSIRDASSDDVNAVMDRVAAHELVTEVLQRGETKQRVRLDTGIEMDIRVVPDESYGAALQYFTGSKEHNIVVRKRAIDRGLKLSEWGLFREAGSQQKPGFPKKPGFRKRSKTGFPQAEATKDGSGTDDAGKTKEGQSEETRFLREEMVAGATEEEVYAALDLQWMPPELRENRGEIEMAAEGTLPKLVELKDIKGDLHMHTTASDGLNSIEEMALAAKERGLKYIAITDHSKRVSMANGLDAGRLRTHWKDIEQVRAKVSGIEILRGIECDILEDATMDLDDDVLAEADWVIGVLHYGLKQPRDQIMKRLMTAVNNPHVDIIGHPSGRMIPNRPGADIDYPALLKACADTGTLLEINAHPKRLDLADIHAAAAAKDYGIPIVISTDSHRTTGFEVLPYGLDVARRAGLEKKHIANTKTWKQFEKLLR
jgi:DNA polymerase (family X)